MRSAVLGAAVLLLALLAGTATACPYNQAVAVQVQAAVVATPVVTVVPAVVPVATVVTPVVQTQVAVVPTVVATPVIQTVVQREVIVERQVQKQRRGIYGGGRQAFGGGGGGGSFLGDTIRAVGDVANSPAGSFFLGAQAARGKFPFGR